MRGILRDRLYNKHYNKLINSRSESAQKKSINTISSVTILAPITHHTSEQLSKGFKYFSKLNIACDVYVLQEKNEVAEVVEYTTIQKCS